MAKHTIEMTDNEVAVLWHALRNWNEGLRGRFPVAEPWDWPDSFAMDAASYKRVLKALVKKVDDA